MQKQRENFVYVGCILGSKSKTLIFTNILSSSIKKIGRKRPSFKTDPTVWRYFLYYLDRLVGFEHIS
jgi:hypothetical protein